MFQLVGFLCVVYPHCHSSRLCPAPSLSLLFAHRFLSAPGMLAEMSILQANGKEAHSRTVTTFFSLECACSFVTVWALNKFPGVWSYIRILEAPITITHTGDFWSGGEIPQKQPPFDLLLTFARLVLPFGWDCF